MSGRIDGVLDYSSAPEGCTGPGITCANEMMFLYESCPRCRIDRSNCLTCSPVRYNCAMAASVNVATDDTVSRERYHFLRLRLNSYSTVRNQKILRCSIDKSSVNSDNLVKAGKQKYHYQHICLFKVYNSVRPLQCEIQ